MEIKHRALTLVNGALIVTLLILAAVTAIQLTKVYAHFKLPIDAAIVLEGAPERFTYAAKYAKQNPMLPIYISSQVNFYKVYLDALAAEDVPLERFKLRTCATDTVTNFTCIADELQKSKYKHLAVITSASHMQRALAVGRIVLGKFGMAVTPLPVLDKREKKESFLKIARDSIRASASLFPGGFF